MKHAPTAAPGLAAMVLRPGRLSDLPAIESIAAASAIGIGSLPPDRERLYEKLRLSTQAFSADADLSGEESYFFVLEDLDTGRLMGTSGIAASAGFGDRFYTYRNELIVHASSELGESNRVHTLHLCHDLTGASLLTSFYIEPALADGPWPQLLSRARLLFMAEHPQRFADRLAAESPGLCDEHGRSPFWEAVGQRFFGIDYPQAERLAGGRSKSFIAELMPQYPIYVPLLPPEAQLAIGQLHESAELPFNILLAEGFEADTYIDLFDAGPTVEAPLASLRSMRLNRSLRVRRGQAEDLGAQAPEAKAWLIANTATQEFRATLAYLPAPQGQDLPLPSDLLERLALSEGDEVRMVALHPEGGMA